MFICLYFSVIFARKGENLCMFSAVNYYWIGNQHFKADQPLERETSLLDVVVLQRVFTFLPKGVSK